MVVETGLAGPHEISIIQNPIDPRDVISTERRLSGDSNGGPPFTVVGYLGSTIRDKGSDLLPPSLSGPEGESEMVIVPSEAGHRHPRPTDLGYARVPREGWACKFPGRRADVRDAYRDCDVVICPSRRESFGRIAAEAMMNGLPVVASDIGPFRDLVSDKAGILFPVDDPNAAAAAIRNLAEDPVLRAELGRCAQVLAAKFEPGPIVRRFMELYGLKRSRDLESGGQVE